LLQSVRRVAVIGPGLDFIDKDFGFDHYPLQTLQPFAVMDSLVRLGLAEAANLRVSLFEINPLALDHLAQAAARGSAGTPYTLQLVLDKAPPWNLRAQDYWQRLGDAIGASAEPLPAPPQVQNVERRAVQVRPEFVAALAPVSLNAVLQRIDLPEDQRFDLVVATNVFLYYSAFEQALAMLNIDAMTASNGVFLTNDLSGEYSGVRLRRSGVVRAAYSPGQEDEVYIYAGGPFQLQLPPQ
jgi:hypothetical protein